MKKKGDTKKHFKDEKIVSLLGKRLSRSCFFLISFTYGFSQPSMNNFGISEFLKTYKGYTKFEFVDFNNDGLQDIFIFGNQQKNFVVHKGLKDSKFSPPEKKFFFFPIDDFKYLTKSAGGDDYYIFVSRNRRLAGLVSFTKSNSLQLLHTLNFNSYPSNIELTDLDSNGINEAVISGNNFDGIVLIRNEGYRLVADTLHRHGVFNEIKVFDFNQDQVQDLIAVDALNNSLNFFENTEIGGFFSTRSIQYDETLYSLVISDLNDDLFKDLLISKEKGIEILLGDSVFSYQQNIKLSYNYTPGKCYTTDVNLNSKTDLITLNLSDNYFNILFDFLESDYSIDYRLDRVTDVKNSSSVSDKRLYLLSREGKFQIIGRKSLWGKNFNLSIGGSPDLLKPARIENEKDFYFVAADTRESRINILKFNNNGINQTIYRIGLLNSFKEFTFSSDLDVLAAFSPRSRFIEIIEKEHSDNNFRSSAYLYAKYPIENILIDQSKKFKVLEVSRTRLFLETLYKEDESYLSENVLHLDSSAISSLIAGNGNIFYWTDKNDSILNLKSYYSGNEKVIYSADIADTIKFRPVLLSNGSEGNNEIISVFHNGEKETILLINDARVVELNSDYGLLSENMNFQNGLNYYSDVLGKKTVLQHLPDDEKLKFFIIDQGSKKLIRSRIVNEFNAYDYFIGKYFNNYYLIYSNKDNNSISFKVLDK